MSMCHKQPTRFFCRNPIWYNNIDELPELYIMLWIIPKFSMYNKLLGLWILTKFDNSDNL